MSKKRSLIPEYRAIIIQRIKSSMLFKSRDVGDVKIPLTLPKGCLVSLFGRPHEVKGQREKPTTMKWLFTDQKGMAKVIGKELCGKIERAHFDVEILRVALQYRVRTWTLHVWILAQRTNKRGFVLTPPLGDAHSIFFTFTEIRDAWRSALAASSSASSAPSSVASSPSSEALALPVVAPSTPPHIIEERVFLDGVVAECFNGDWSYFTRVSGLTRP